ncbi:hypothetical protein BDZ45DRAFT_682611 [Acephala macrosclerotiorum]|nr:hypothetical protein BDZ45DRAFT_682611 [Acephala macrosclerotiorum]
MHAQSLLFFLLYVPTALAVAIERQSVQVSNRTITYGSAFFGGCCQGTLDDMGYNADCYNATTVATNVWGSTFGPQTRYSCITALIATQTFADAYFAICCKYVGIYIRLKTFPIIRGLTNIQINAYTRKKIMSCNNNGGDT